MSTTQTPKSKIRKAPLPVETSVKVEEVVEEAVAPSAPKKAKYVKPSSLINDEIVKTLFEDIENKPKDDVISLVGTVERVFTSYGGTLLLTMPREEFVKAFWPERDLLAYPEPEGAFKYPWSFVTEDDTVRLKIGIAAKSKFTFEQVFRALEDKDHPYGYGKEGSTVEVYVHANTYKDYPSAGTFGISLKMVAPIALILPSAEPASPMCKEFDFDFCLRECRREEGGELLVTIMEQVTQDHLDYLFSLDTPGSNEYR